MSSETPFFHKTIPNAWKSSIPTRPSPSSVTTIRSLTLTLPQDHGSDHLPLYHVNATEVEKLDYNPKKSPFNLLPKIVCLTFAALGYQTMSTSQDQQPCILGPSMVIAFVASLSVVLVSNNDTMKHSYPRLAAIVELIGYLSFTLSFLVMTRVFFSASLILWTVMGGLAMAWILLALLIRFFT